MKRCRRNILPICAALAFLSVSGPSCSLPPDVVADWTGLNMTVPDATVPMDAQPADAEAWTAPLDAAWPSVGRSCGPSDRKFVLLSSAGALYEVSPDTQVVRPLGTPDCGGATMQLMTMDELNNLWLLSTEHRLYRVALDSLACTFVELQVDATTLATGPKNSALLEPLLALQRDTLLGIDLVTGRIRAIGSLSAQQLVHLPRRGLFALSSSRGDIEIRLVDFSQGHREMVGNTRGPDAAITAAAPWGSDLLLVIGGSLYSLRLPSTLSPLPHPLAGSFAPVAVAAPVCISTI